MSSEVMVAAEIDPQREITIEIGARARRTRSAWVADWLDRHVNSAALAIVAAGFVLRLLAASRSYLNPDEALHYLLLNQYSVFLAYKASLTNAHPPLIYVLLYFWRFLGRSELMLRLPSVFAGTAFCWLVFEWVERILGKTSAVIAVILATFSPALIALSAEVREYALLLCFIAAALTFHEGAFEDKSSAKMWLFNCFLYLAIVTHYSAVFFTISMGIYTIARIAERGIPRNVIAVWAGGQAGALAIYGFLYVTHVSRIKESIASWAMPYDQAYFRLDRESIFTFTWVHTRDIFLFLFEQEYVADVILAAFLAGVIILFTRDLLVRSSSRIPKHLGMLLTLPSLSIWGASIAGVYPYVGSRHTVLLAPFMIASAAYLFATIAREKVWAGILIAALLIGIPSGKGRLTEGGMAKKDQRRYLMTDAIQDVRRSIPPGDVIMVDFQGTFSLAFYLCGAKMVVPVTMADGGYRQFGCAGYSVVSLPVWKLIDVNFQTQFEKTARAYAWAPGMRVWVFQAGWGANLDVTLAKKASEFPCLAPNRFGGNITFIPFVVGPNLQPVTPSKHC